MRPSDLFAGVPNELGFYQTRTAKHVSGEPATDSARYLTRKIKR